MGSHPDILRRPTFEQRLLRALGPTFALGLFLLWLVGLEVAYLVFQQAAYRPLEQEAEVIEHAVLRDGVTLHPEFYFWDEPHHRFAQPRIDPFFVVLFDSLGRPIRISENVQQARIPLSLVRQLMEHDYGDAVLDSLRLVYHTYLLKNRYDRPVGMLWIARYDPGWRRQLLLTALLLGGGLLLFFFVLMALTRRTARRVLRPLQQITRTAASLNPRALQQRIPVPEDADRETTLLAHTLNEQLDRLQEVLESLQSFSYHAAHELQTPLTVFIGHLEFLLRRPRSQETYQERLRMLLEEARGMQRLVHQLLLLARLEEDTEALEQSTVALHDLLNSLIQGYREAAAQKGLRLLADIREPLTVCGYEQLLQEALENLLDNALKYTDSGTITLRAYREGEEAVVEVEDTGRGMATEDLARATHTFFRSARHPDIPGYGLGLSLVRRIVEFHRGTLHLESTPGSGTRVMVRLPFATPTRPSES